MKKHLPRTPNSKLPLEKYYKGECEWESLAKVSHSHNAFHSISLR